MYYGGELCETLTQTCYNILLILRLNLIDRKWDTTSCSVVIIVPNCYINIIKKCFGFYFVRGVDDDGSTKQNKNDNKNIIIVVRGLISIELLT